ncbi:hypothetical protein MTsPCn9_31250 [Croceitalea sp. MTPC9]|uniref:DUF4199 domain-containing protein n=1 Tax=unclassified Croceitalea TaxID=2632280 RepID=UPI002B3654CB|nr:hypothetical protein MTsPCn6_17370 [Croceitalea sp. MTPC6]GMN18185.1 hypothetical protein MTsPCn9_31250 [Croceitalea sp. MTPC9]
MKKTVLRYGIYGAITICILFLLGWFIGENLDYSSQEIIGYASMIVSLSFVFFGIKHFRDKENEGQISFKKAFIIGLLISLITAIAFGLIDVLYIKVLNPNFAADYYANAVETMRNSVPAAEFEAKLAELESQKEMFSDPFFTFFLMASTVFIIGLIISLISSLVLQRK